jgi:hypothetical protein
MNLAEQELYSRALSLSNNGNRVEAHQILDQLLGTYPNDVNILLAFAYTSPTLDEARQVLQQAQYLAPQNPEVTRAMQWLAAQETAQRPQVVVNTYQTQWNQSKNMKKRNNTGFIVLVLALIAVVGVAALIIVGSTGVLGEQDAKDTLSQFMQYASSGNTDEAYNLVLPTITKDQLKASFLDPNAANLRDFSRMDFSSSQYYSLDGGGSYTLKGTVFYRTIGKSAFEAQVQRVDADEAWYVVSLNLAPPTK